MRRGQLGRRRACLDNRWDAGYIEKYGDLVGHVESPARDDNLLRKRDDQTSCWWFVGVVSGPERPYSSEAGVSEIVRSVAGAGPLEGLFFDS